MVISVNRIYSPIPEENADILLMKTLLCPIAEASYDEDKLCFEGSRGDTLRLLESWTESESSPRLFWLHGSAGLGKTAISNTIARLLHDQNRLAGFVSSDTPQDPKRIIPTVAYHLATWHADYQKYILDVLRGPRQRQIFAGLDSQFDLLMKQPMSGINMHSPPVDKPLVIVLDSLENCFEMGDGRRSLVDYILDIATLAPWLKVFVTSRSTHMELSSCQVEVQAFGLDDPRLDLQHDITVYAELHIEHRRSRSKWTSRMESDTDGLFTRICRSFSSLPRTILESVGLVANDIPVIRDTVVVLAQLISVELPTEEVAFYFMHAIHPSITQDCLRDIIKSLSPIVITVDRNLLQIPFPLEILPRILSQSWGHSYADMDSLKLGLARYCFDVMGRELRLNICDIYDPQQRNEDDPDLKEKISTQISGILQYCSMHWMDLAVQLGVSKFQDTVSSFLCSRKALLWLEVLNLLGKLDSGKNILLKCSDQFQVSKFHFSRVITI